MKKLILITMIITTVLLSGCETINNDVPLVLYNEVDPFILEFKEKILYEADVNRVKIISYDSENSQLRQNEIIDNIFLDNPRVIVINPVDRLSAYALIDKAKLNDIPLIFINREPLEKDINLWESVYYLGAPAENSAMIQVEMIQEIFGDPTDLSVMDKNDDNQIQLVVLKGEQGHQDAEIRTDVVLAELENLGYDLEILSIEVCNWQEQIAFDSMTDLIKNLDQTIEIVISNNDAMAIGAIKALIENDLFEDVNQNGVIEHDTEIWVPVIGIDGISDAIPYIDNGYLFGTVINDNDAMSEALIELIEAVQSNDFSNLSYEIEDDHYIWIDYQKYEKEE